MTDPCPGSIVGISEEASRLRDFIGRAAACSDPVTLVGEHGTGKQLAATLIHEASGRRRGPFLMIDCSLFYERELKRELFGHRGGGGEPRGKRGLLEFAARGTCYLSRVEELTPGLQADLLRFLTTGSFTRLGDGKEVSSNARVIASSDKNLRGLVDAGLFDAALYGLLSRLSVRLAPLRERKGDIPAIVEHFLRARSADASSAEPVTIDPDAMRALEAYPWPDNLDEMVGEVERLLEGGTKRVRAESLSTAISSYWLGQRCDPEVRRVLEELDSQIREFKVFSRLESELGENPSSLDDWLESDACSQHGLMEEL